MRISALGLASLLLLTGCSSSPAVESAESAESIVQRACETRTKDNYSALAQSLFVEAANLNENYRELARANNALIAFGKIVETVGTGNPSLKALAIKALDDVSTVESYCG